MDNNKCMENLMLCLEMPIILFGGAYSLAKLSFECSTLNCLFVLFFDFLFY